MRLSTRLALAMIALALVTTAVLGILNYQSVVALLMPRSLDSLQGRARLTALVMDASLLAVRADVNSGQFSDALRGPMMARLAKLPEAELSALDAEWRKRVAQRFVAELAAKPDYAMVRVIGVADGGMELVRVDRLGPEGAIRIASPEQLSRRGDRDYFIEGIATPPNDVHVSKIRLNRTATEIEVPHVPTLHVAAPIRQPDGAPFAVLVVNVDLRPTIARLRSRAVGDNQIYMINEDGDYLVHPDPAREFGFDRGTRYRIQDEFPAFATILQTSDSKPQLIDDRDGQRYAFGWEWVRLAGGPKVAVIESRPFSAFMMLRAAVRDSTLLGGAAALLLAIMMAVPLARSLTRPLVKITRAVEGFSRGEPIAAIAGGGPEITVLARAFSRMASESQRKTAELNEEIEQRSRLTDVLNNTINNMVDPVLVADAQGMVIITNAAARKLFGQLSGVGVLNTTRSFDRFYPDGTPFGPDDSPLLRAFRGETIEDFEFVVEPIGTGRRSHLVANGRPLRSESGKLQGAVMVYHDITLTKKGEEALRQSEQMARAIIDSALDAFVQIDRSGAVLAWSPQAEAMFGWPRAEAIGQNIGNLIFSPQQLREGSAEYARFLDSVGLGRPGYRVEIEAIRRDGSAIPIEVAMTALPRDDGFVTNAFMRDLTDKIVSDEQLRQSQKMESIGQLTGGIAHDFNNMLTVITGTIDILGDAVADRPQLAAIAKLISEAADRGSELTRLLLAFARKQPLRPDDTDVNALLTGLESLLRSALGEQIEIELVLQSGIWPIFVDRGQLDSALVNLAVNARDAMPDGGKLTLETCNVVLDQEFARRMGGVEEGAYVMIAITDSGCGIPDEIRDKVFDPFFTTKEVGKGTGLGLSMVYGFIKQSGGHITLYSEIGLGTTFRIYLPRAKAEPERIAPAAPEAAAIGGHETILIVEDDALVRNYVTSQLKSLGYTTLSVANAAAALAMSDKRVAFDLLFTDIVMPGKMNGVQLADEMARRHPRLKVLYTSGYSENALIHNNRLDSDVLLLSKPYRRNELARMVRLALDIGTPPAAGDVPGDAARAAAHGAG